MRILMIEDLQYTLVHETNPYLNAYKQRFTCIKICINFFLLFRKSQTFFYSAWIHKDSLLFSLCLHSGNQFDTKCTLVQYTYMQSQPCVIQIYISVLYLSIFLLSEYYSTESNFSIICYRSKSTFAVFNLFKTYSLKIYSTLGALK